MVCKLKVRTLFGGHSTKEAQIRLKSVAPKSGSSPLKPDEAATPFKWVCLFLGDSQKWVVFLWVFLKKHPTRRTLKKTDPSTHFHFVRMRYPKNLAFPWPNGSNFRLRLI